MVIVGVGFYDCFVVLRDMFFYDVIVIVIGSGLGVEGGCIFGVGSL